MQQRDQAGSGLVFDAEFRHDPRPDLTCRARQRCANPGFQLVLQYRRHAAAFPFVVEAGQSLDSVFLVKLVPDPDRVVIQEQDFDDGSATHAVIEKDQRVAPAGAPPSSSRASSIKSRRDSLSRKPRRIMQPSRIACKAFGKRSLRVPAESGYSLRSRFREPP